MVLAFNEHPAKRESRGRAECYRKETSHPQRSSPEEYVTLLFYIFLIAII